VGLSVFFVNWPIMQVVCINIMNLFMIIYITNIKPFIGRFRNNLEIINDFCMSEVTLMMMCFTDWVAYPPAQSMYGNVMMAMTSLVVSFNMSIVIWTSMRTLNLIYIKNKLKALNFYNKKFKMMVEDTR
jgi:hypothetical protein